MNDSKSYLMWKVYANRGCAIETTFERLQISFDSFPGEIEGGTVDYIDYRRETIQVGNIYFPVVKKDLPYRDEKEFRLLFWQYSLANQPVAVMSDGFKVRVDLNNLISKIWLSPPFAGASSEFTSIVDAKKLDCEICTSSVAERFKSGASST